MDYRLSLGAADGNPDNEMAVIRQFLEQRVEAIVCCNVNPSPERTREFHRAIAGYSPYW